MPVKEKKQEQADEVAGEKTETSRVEKEKPPFKAIPLGKAEKVLPLSKGIEKGSEAGAAEETSEKKGLRELVVGGITTLSEKLGIMGLAKDKTAMNRYDLTFGAIAASWVALCGGGGYLLGYGLADWLITHGSMASSGVIPVEALFTTAGLAFGALTLYATIKYSS